MPKMKAVQVPKAGGDFEIVERDIPQPGPGQVRIRVQACGVCHSDVLTKEGWPGIAYPRVPGHEIAGVIDEVGAGVTAWKKGQRVGVGWHGGQDGTCPQLPPRRLRHLREPEDLRDQLRRRLSRSTWSRRWKRSRACRNRSTRPKLRR